ncbi:MAG: T9SS type A sorting domain-containing protein [Chloroherpetonaceae bacterium]
MFTKVVGTAEKWEKFVEVAEKLGKKIKSNPSNPLHNIIYPTVQFLATGALSASGIGSIAGAVAGLFDFFTGGGQPDPSPTYFGFNLEVAGTIKTEYIVNEPMSIVIPASKSNALTQPNQGSSVPLVYDKPVGLFNLTSTPVVKYKSYFQNYPGTSQSRQYNDFQIQNFQYAVNPESGLQLDSVRVWIVADVTANVSAIPPDQNPDLALLAQWVQGQNLNVSGGRRPIQLESMIDGKYVFGSIPVGENAIVGQTIQAPVGNQTADITIKVKAVFHRKDNPSEKPVVFIATYEPDLVADGIGRYPLPPPPPPAHAFRTVNVTKQYEGGTFANQTISQYTPSTTVTVNPTETIGAHTYPFIAWSDGNTDLSRTITVPGVTSLIAEYKGFRLSNIPDLAGKSGGSRTVAIDVSNSNLWYQVYESNNAIWLSHSTNAGASWQPEVKLGDGKNPSMANGGAVWVNVLNGGIDFRTVGFLDGNLNLGSIWSSILHNPGQPPSLYIDPIPDAHPCIAYKHESDGSWSYYIVYEHRLRQGFTNNYPNTELRLIRLGFLSSGFGVKSLHTVPNSLYAQQYVLLYPAIAVDNAINQNVNTPATIVWQNYLPSVSDGIKVCEANLVNGSFVFGAQHTFAAGQSSTVQYQKPTIVLDASNHRHIAWQALDHSHPYGARTVILYKGLPTWNDPSQPLTKFLYYDGKTNPSIGFANGTVSLVWDYSGGTCYGATRSTSGSWGAWQSFLGEEPRLMQTGTKQIAHAKANSGLFDVKLTSLSGGGGSAQERGLSGGGKGGGSQVVTNSGGTGGNESGGESISAKERIGALLYKENEQMISTARLELTLSDVGLNGSSRTGLTYHDLGANLLPDTLALSPSSVFSLLKSRRFTLADTINQITATVKVHSERLYDLTQNHPVQLAVELFNVSTGASIALSQTALVTASDTAKDFLFTMNLPTTQSGTEVELRVKVLGFAIQTSHKASALNTIELVNASGANAIVNRIGNQSSQTESVGSVPTKFALSQNYPNPFNPVTVIRYELPTASAVKLQVFDVLGRVVATVVNERRDAGIYEAVFNASTLSSGTYFYRLQASATNGASSSNFVETKKMMLVK